MYEFTDNQFSFEMGGDCSAVRRAVLSMKGRRRASIGVGWPAGITGTLSLEHNTHGRAVASASMGITISTQPAGTAGGTVITGIVTDLPYIVLVYTPTTGGAGINLLNENQDANTKPTLTVKV